MSEQVKATTACPDCGHGLHYPVTCGVLEHVPGTRFLTAPCGCNGGGPSR